MPHDEIVSVLGAVHPLPPHTPLSIVLPTVPSRLRGLLHAATALRMRGRHNASSQRMIPRTHRVVLADEPSEGCDGRRSVGFDGAVASNLGWRAR